jgi:hypothetical protein
MGPTPLAGRQVSADHARAIAETGGSVGVWHFFPSLDKYVDGLKGMADMLASITWALARINSSPAAREPPFRKARRLWSKSRRDSSGT